MKTNVRWRMALTIGVVLLSVVAGGFVFIRHWMTHGFYRVGQGRERVTATAPSTAALMRSKEGAGVSYPVANGVTLHGFSTGKGGRDAIVVHGGPGIPPAAPWALSREGSVEGVLNFHFYHQRGCGESTRPLSRAPEGNPYAQMKAVEAELGFAAQIADLEQLRRQLGVDKPVLVGHSFGALLAALYAAEFPEHVGGLVFIAPANLVTMPKEEDGFSRVRSRLPPALHPEFDAYRDASFDFPSLLKKDDVELASFFAQFGKYYLTAMGTSRSGVGGSGLNVQPGGLMVLASYLSLGQRHDYAEALAKVEAPVLVIHGDNDLQPLSDTEAFARYFRKARVVRIPNAGHFAFEEAPSVLAQHLQAFVRELKK